MAGQVQSASDVDGAKGSQRIGLGVVHDVYAGGEMDDYLTTRKHPPPVGAVVDAADHKVSNPGGQIARRPGNATHYHAAQHSFTAQSTTDKAIGPGNKYFEYLQSYRPFLINR